MAPLFPCPQGQRREAAAGSPSGDARHSPVCSVHGAGGESAAPPDPPAAPFRTLLPSPSPPPPPPAPDSAALLRQACTDLEQRLRAGEPCQAEDWLSRFPTLAGEVELALELIYAEYVVREDLGQRPDPAEWYARFPQWQERLQRLFQLHDRLDAGATADSVAAPVAPASPDPGHGTPPGGGPARLGPYELLGEIGRGAMGVVYKARQRSLNRLVALKMLSAEPRPSAEDLARFRTEAEAVARLQHPHIVQIHDIGEQDGRPYLCLELVDGGSLARRLAGSPLAPHQAAELVETLARAMHRAHQAGIVHRDLKPANVLLTADGTPKITDFGLAKRLDQEPGATQATQSGQILGTPCYMAPEQALGQRKEIGPATDVYGLGAILYELLAGRPPFRGATLWQTLGQVVSEPPVPPSRLRPDVPPELERVCLTCLQKEPARRHASAEALADDLRRFRAGPPVPAETPGPERPEVRAALRRPAVRRGLLSFSAAFGLLLGVVVWLCHPPAPSGPGELPGPDPSGGPQPGPPGAAEAVPGKPVGKKLPASPKGDAVAAIKPDAGAPYWEALRVGSGEEKFEQIAFPTRRVGYAASREAVYRTEDGGREWKRVRKSRGRVHFLYFQDAQTGWLGTDQLDYTDDGGETWSRVALPPAEKLLAVNDLATGPNGWMLAGGTTHGGNLVLFCKGSAAADWQEFVLVTKEGAGAAEQPYRKWSLGGLAILGPREAVLVLFRGDPEEGVVLRTTSGFENWTTAFTVKKDLYRVRFADARRGWLAGSHGALWGTEDGGLTWQPQPNPGEVTLSCLAFDPQGRLGLAPLYQGKVMVTTDRKGWRVVDAPLAHSMPSAAVVDPGCAYVLGADGRIARYVDPRVKGAE
jgi:serine/threonine protein kinase/photosystem II stability/assembly factor-like uncharacterized protein